MACTLGIEQNCNECRMCGNGKGGKKMTNFERIKGMSVDELAEFLLVFDGETDGYNYVIASDNEFSLYDSCDSKEESIRKQKEWLESECDAG